jgi:hypothetical protein
MWICQGLLSTVASFGTQTDGTDPLWIPFGSLTQSRKVFRSLPTLICFKHNVLVPTDYIYGFDLEFSLIPLYKLLKHSAMEVSQARNWMSTKSCFQSCWGSFQQHSRHEHLLANLFVDCEASCVCRRQHS